MTAMPRGKAGNLSLYVPLIAGRKQRSTGTADPRRFKQYKAAVDWLASDRVRAFDVLAELAAGRLSFDDVLSLYASGAASLGPVRARVQDPEAQGCVALTPADARRAGLTLIAAAQRAEGAMHPDEPTPAQRAERARISLEAYRNMHGLADTPTDNVVDLIADLLHLAHHELEHTMDSLESDILDRAWMHVVAEVEGEPA